MPLPFHSVHPGNQIYGKGFWGCRILGRRASLAWESHFVQPQIPYSPGQVSSPLGKIQHDSVNTDRGPVKPQALAGPPSSYQVPRPEESPHEVQISSAFAHRNDHVQSFPMPHFWLRRRSESDSRRCSIGSSLQTKQVPP